MAPEVTPTWTCPYCAQTVQLRHDMARAMNTYANSGPIVCVEVEYLIRHSCGT